MDIKARLRNYRTIKDERDQIGRRLEELEAALYYPKIQRLSGMPSAPSHGNAQEDMAGRHMELVSLYREKQQELEAEQLAIERAIAGLDPPARQLLRALHIEGMKWKDASAAIHYSRRQANRIYDEALETLERENVFT